MGRIWNTIYGNRSLGYKTIGVPAMLLAGLGALGGYGLNFNEGRNQKVTSLKDSKKIKAVVGADDKEIKGTLMIEDDGSDALGLDNKLNSTYQIIASKDKDGNDTKVFDLEAAKDPISIEDYKFFKVLPVGGSNNIANFVDVKGFGEEYEGRDFFKSQKEGWDLKDDSNQWIKVSDMQKKGDNFGIDYILMNDIQNRKMTTTSDSFDINVGNYVPDKSLGWIEKARLHAGYLESEAGEKYTAQLFGNKLVFSLPTGDGNYKFHIANDDKKLVENGASIFVDFKGYGADYKLDDFKSGKVTSEGVDEFIKLNPAGGKLVVDEVLYHPDHSNDASGNVWQSLKYSIVQAGTLIPASGKGELPFNEKEKGKEQGEQRTKDISEKEGKKRTLNMEERVRQLGGLDNRKSDGTNMVMAVYDKPGDAWDPIVVVPKTVVDNDPNYSQLFDIDDTKWSGRLKEDVTAIGGNFMKTIGAATTGTYITKFDENLKPYIEKRPGFVRTIGRGVGKVMDGLTFGQVNPWNEDKPESKDAFKYAGKMIWEGLAHDIVGGATKSTSDAVRYGLHTFVVDPVKLVVDIPTGGSESIRESSDRYLITPIAVGANWVGDAVPADSWGRLLKGDVYRDGKFTEAKEWPVVAYFHKIKVGDGKTVEDGIQRSIGRGVYDISAVIAGTLASANPDKVVDGVQHVWDEITGKHRSHGGKGAYDPIPGPNVPGDTPTGNGTIPLTPNGLNSAYK